MPSLVMHLQKRGGVAEIPRLCSRRVALGTPVVVLPVREEGGGFADVLYFRRREAIAMVDCAAGEMAWLSCCRRRAMAVSHAELLLEEEGAGVTWGC